MMQSAFFFVALFSTLDVENIISYKVLADEIFGCLQLQDRTCWITLL